MNHAGLHSEHGRTHAQASYDGCLASAALYSKTGTREGDQLGMLPSGMHSAWSPQQMSPAYSITSGFQIEQAASLRLRNLILYVDCLLWPVTWRLAFRSCTRGDTCTMFVSYEPPINGASECYDLSLAPVDTVLPAGLQRNAALSISSLFAELERSSRSSGPPLEAPWDVEQ